MISWSIPKLLWRLYKKLLRALNVLMSVCVVIILIISAALMQTLALPIQKLDLGGMDATIPTKTFAEYNADFQTLQQPRQWDFHNGKNPLKYAIIPPPPSNESFHSYNFTAVLLGDSYANPMARVLTSISEDFNTSFVMAALPSCAPFLDLNSTSSTREPENPDPRYQARSIECIIGVRPSMRDLAEQANSNVVILTANWISTVQMASDMAGSSSYLRDTVSVLRRKGMKVVVIGVIPSSHYDVPKCMADPKKKCGNSTPMRELPRDQDYSSKAIHRTEASFAMNEYMKNEAVKFEKEFGKENFGFIDAFKAMCYDNECVTVVGRNPVYYDINHLSPDGTLLLKSSIVRQLKKWGYLPGSKSVSSSILWKGFVELMTVQK